MKQARPKLDRRRRGLRAPPVIRAPIDSELLALDPGVLHPAAARFAGGKLVAAARTPVDASWAALGNAERAKRVALAMAHWALEARAVAPTHIALEWPSINRGQTYGKDPNELLKILAAAAAVVGAFAAANPDIVVISATPRDIWGSMPKALTGDPRRSVRGGRVWSRLSPEEQAALELTHDAIDSAGIGLWALGLLDPVRVIHHE
jgi:hypothetical protein